jgi:hypothetical protein
VRDTGEQSFAPLIYYTTLQAGTPIWGVYVLEKYEPLTLTCVNVQAIAEPEVLRKDALRMRWMRFDTAFFTVILLMPLILLLLGIVQTRRNGLL